MKQQINLFTPALPAGKDVWSLSSTVGMVGVIVLIVALSAWGLHSYSSVKQSEMAALQARAAELPEQIAQMERQRNEIKPDPAILAEQRGVRDKIAEQRELLKLLDQLQPGVANRGFSRFLYGLAEAGQDGLWVTHFVFDLAQKQVLLEGEAQRADDVPGLMRRLGGTAAFSGMGVGHFSVAEADAGHGFKIEAMIRAQGGADGRE